MKKIFLAAVLLAATSGSLSAQTKNTGGSKLSAGFELGVPLPVGGFNKVYDIGFGGSIKAELPVSDKVNFTMTAGYLSYTYTKGLRTISDGPYRNSAGFLPLKAGGKVFLSDIFYGEAEAGIRIGTDQNNGNAFIYAPGLGFAVPVSKSGSNAIDFGARYEGWSQNGGNTGQIGLRVAYRFGM